MGWVNNTSARPVLKIGPFNYSSALVNFQVSDSSIITGGILQTSGTITLREGRGTPSLVDYEKKKFGRGQIVRLDLETDGGLERHPRGSLLILDSEYNPEDREVNLDVGCLLSLYALTDNISNLKHFTPYDLPDEAGFNDLSQALQAESAFLYVDKNGLVQKANFFGTDGFGSYKDPAQWVTVRDQTALASSPLGIGAPVPDRLVISFSWAVPGESTGGGTDDNGNTIDEDASVSNYFIEHPANIYRTQLICQPLPTGDTVCADVALRDQKQTFSVTTRTSSRRYYGGPGGSVSTELSVTEGPAVEVQGSYYAERYSWEVARAETKEKKANVTPKGLTMITQSRREKTYEYGPGGELVKTIEFTYRNLLNAMTPQDWRASGQTIENETPDPLNPNPGTNRGFLTEPPTSLFLSQVVTSTWQYFDDRTIEQIETITSSATCGKTGIYSKDGPRTLLDIGAYENGVTTTETRTSRNGLVNPDQPPRNPGGVPLVTESDSVVNDSSKYVPTPAGSLTQTFTVPFTVASDTEETARARAVTYGHNQRWALEGDSAGIRIAEGMRPEIFNYFPGMPFTFYDPTEDVVVKLRMNSTTWGVNPREALFSTDGIFIGISNAEIRLGNNTLTPEIRALQQALHDLPKPGDKPYQDAIARRDVQIAIRDAVPQAGNPVYEAEVLRYDAAWAALQAQIDAVPQAGNPVYDDEKDRFDLVAAPLQTQLDETPQPGDTTYDDAVTNRDAVEAEIPTIPQAGEPAYDDATTPEQTAFDNLLALRQSELVTLNDQLEDWDLEAQDLQDQIDTERQQLDLWLVEISQLQADQTAEFAQQQIWVDEINTAQALIDVEQNQLDTWDQNAIDWRDQIDSDIAAVTQWPSVVDDSESSISNGRSGTDIEEVLTMKIFLGVNYKAAGTEGNQGVVPTFNEPIETQGNINLGLQIDGVKISKDANLIASGTGGALMVDKDEILMGTGAIVIDRDLFDPNVEAGPDWIFGVISGPKQPVATFDVMTLAPFPDFTFNVYTTANGPDQTFEVRTITDHVVLVFTQSFDVTRGPSAPDQIFPVFRGAEQPERWFTVMAGPLAPDEIFGVKVYQPAFQVTTGVREVDGANFFTVSVGPDVAPRPDVDFVVSIAGPGLGPSQPDETFSIKPGPDLPTRFVDVLVMPILEVQVAEAPLTVTVGADVAFFDITVGPDVPNNTFAVEVLEP